jgi:hypothetical protein
MAVDTGVTGTRQTMGGADACQGGRDRDEERAKAAIDRSRSGSTGSAIMAHFLAAADMKIRYDRLPAMHRAFHFLQLARICCKILQRDF